MSAKSKKSFISRLFKWLLILFVLLIAVLAIIPIFFKDELKELALKEANKTLFADVAVGDFDLTFISSFPKLKLVFEDVTVIGRDQFEGVHLVDIKEFEAKVNFWSVVNGENIEVNSIVFNEPSFDVRVLQDSTANYDIVATDGDANEEVPEVEEADTSASSFSFKLNTFELNNANIRYDDRASDMFAKIVNLTHHGTFAMSNDLMDIVTETTIEKLTYAMDGVNYLNEVNTELVLNLLNETKEGSDKYTLKENELRLNNLNLSFDGFYEMFKGYDEIDLTLVADRTTFKDLLSLVPAFYMTGYESMVADGAMKLSGNLKGRMDEEALPAFDFNLAVDNGKVNYPDLPGSIENIGLNVNANFVGGTDLDKMVIDIKDFNAKFAENSINMKLLTKNVMTDPYINSTLKANVILDELGKFIPLEEGETYQGKLTSDVQLEGNVSAIEEERYTDFKALGMLMLEGFNYASSDLQEGVAIAEMKFLFSPEKLDLAALKGKMGETNFIANGEVKNYMEYVFKDEALAGFFNVDVDYLDVNAYMSDSSEEETEETGEEEAVADSTANEPILVPNNIDFVLSMNIDKVKYEDLFINNVNGKVIVRNQEVNMDQLRMQAMGGTIAMTGKYNTQDERNPFVDFSYDIQEVNIQELVNNFVTIEKLAPIAKHAKGNLSTSLKMKSGVTPDFSPLYNTLQGDGNLFTNQVQISGYKPLERMSEVLSINELKNTTLKNVDIDFAFEDGKVKVKPFAVNVAGIRTDISGTTSFEQEIDYSMKMQVPKEKIPGDIVKIVEDAMKKVKNVPGLKLKGLPDMIPVNAKLTNTVTDPKFETDMREQVKALVGDVGGSVKDAIDETKEAVKDTVKAVIDDKKEEAKEALRKKKQQLLDDAQKQADKVVSEAKKLADKTRDEGDKAAEKIIKEAGSNPIKKRIAEEGAKKTRDAANKKADQIESEAQQKADQIMKEARERADKLE